MQRFLCLLSSFLGGVSVAFLWLIWMRQGKLLLGAASGILLIAMVAGLAHSGLRIAGRDSSEQQPKGWVNLLRLAAVVLISWLLTLLSENSSLLSQALTLRGALPVLLVMGVFVLTSELSRALSPPLVDQLATGEKIPLYNSGLWAAAILLGAAAGSASSGALWWTIGTHWTVILAGAIALLSWITARSFQPALRSVLPDGPSAEPSPLSARTVPWAFAVTGFAMLASYFVWLRILAVFVRNQNAALTQFVSVLLLGLAIGVGGGAWRLKQRQKQQKPTELGFFVDLQMGLGLVALGLLFFYDYLPQFSQRFLDDGAFWGLYPSLLGAATLFAPAVLVGISFSAALAVAASQRDPNAIQFVARVGGLHFAGGLLGLAVTIFGLIPVMGLQGACASLASMLLMVGLVTSWISRAQGEKASLLPHGGMIGGIGLVLLLTPGNFLSPQQSNAGGTLFYEDKSGFVVSVAIAGENAVDSGRTLYYQGQALIFEESAEVVDQLLGRLVAALVPQAQNVLALDSGRRAGPQTFTDSNVSNVVLVAPFEDLFRAAMRLKSEENLLPPNLHFEQIIADRRRFLREAGDTYDVILSGPDMPLGSDEWSHFTREYYELVASRLSEQGVFIQWFSTQQLKEADLKRILSTYRSVFFRAALFRVGYDEMLITTMPDALTQKELEVILNPLSQTGALNRDESKSLKLVDDKELQVLVTGGRVFTDNNAIMWPAEQDEDSISYHDEREPHQQD